MKYDSQLRERAQNVLRWANQQGEHIDRKTPPAIEALIEDAREISRHILNQPIDEYKLPIDHEFLTANKFRRSFGCGDELYYRDHIAGAGELQYHSGYKHLLLADYDDPFVVKVHTRDKFQRLVDDLTTSDAPGKEKSA